MKARSEVSGRDASTAPSVVNRLPASEIPATSSAVMITLSIKYIDEDCGAKV